MVSMQDGEDLRPARLVVPVVEGQGDAPAGTGHATPDCSLHGPEIAKSARAGQTSVPGGVYQAQPHAVEAWEQRSPLRIRGGQRK